MKIIKFYAVKIKNGKEVDRVEVGTARVDPENVRISAEKYDGFKRTARKLLQANKGEYVRLVTEDGKIDTFGGYPASGFLGAVKFDFKETFSDELHSLVRKSGLSQRAFAESIGVPLRTLEDWLAGQRTPNDLTKESCLNRASERLGNQ